MDIADVQMGALADGTLVGCDWSTNLSPETTRIEEKAAAQGIILSNYDHVEFFLPEEAACTWGGLGQVGGPYTWERIEYGCNNPSVRMHEIARVAERV